MGGKEQFWVHEDCWNSEKIELIENKILPMLQITSDLHEPNQKMKEKLTERRRVLRDWPLGDGPAGDVAGGGAERVLGTKTLGYFSEPALCLYRFQKG